MSAIYKGSILAGGRSAATTVFIDRRVSVRSVVCPTCSAEVGVKSVSSTGKPTHHESRRRMALRAEAHDYSANEVRFLRQLGASERRVIRQQNKVGQTELAKLLDISPVLLGRWERGTSRPSTGPEAARYGQWLREHRDVVA